MSPVIGGFHRRAFWAIGLGLTAAARGQQEPPARTRADGRSIQLELVKHAHQRALEDVAEIRALSAEVEADLERDTAHVVNLKTVKKLERIERLAKSAAGRMRRR